MIAVEDVLNIHELLIEAFGGISGVRDRKLLKLAISRPLATFDGVELYPTISEKAAAILECLLINRPFVDGNKRTAYTILRLQLLNENIDLKASEDEKYGFIIAVESGKMSFDQMVNWIEEHSE